MFESMTTIKKAKREEITILYKDKKNLETLKFEDSGAINFNVINDGIEKNGKGIWFAEENYLTIIVETDTTYGTYSVDGNTLMLIINAEETENTYGYSTILKYIHQSISLLFKLCSLKLIKNFYKKIFLDFSLQ